MMRTILLAAAVAALLLPALPTAAHAHGGKWRGPPDAVPPGLRPPTDPIPPAPPPPEGPPTTPPVTPSPRTPGPSAPETPGAAPGPTTGPNLGGSRARPRTAARSYEDWTYWYHNNKDDIENLKRALYRPVGSDNPIFQPGQHDEASRSSTTRMTEKRVEEVVIPTLLWAMDPNNSGHQDTESAAYIALAKVARSPDHVALIQRGLDQRLDRGLIVQESSALALGLLRRARPDEQLSARDLDRVRDFLFDVFEDDDYQARTRGFAALALGLLGDQPTGSGEYAGDRPAAEAATTARLFSLLEAGYAHNDLPIALLMAIGMQAPDSVTPGQREALKEAALKGRLRRESVQDLVRSYAVLALGRIGTAAEIDVLENVLRARRGVDDIMRRSAAIGLGLLARQVRGEDRVEVARTLLDALDRIKDNSTRNFAIISTAYVLIEEIRAGATDVVQQTRAADLLVEVAADGRPLQRPFGALALGLVIREIGNRVEIEAYQDLQQDALDVLQEGLGAPAMPKRSRAAFATALGIAGDTGSRSALLAILADEKEDKELRGYAALALGLVGEATPAVKRAIADALLERSSVELRRQAAGALGLLGNPQIPGTRHDAVGLLLEELKDAKSQNHKGQVVLALARVGDHRAADALVELVRDEDEQDLTRALACAGLGLVGDLEWIPSLARISKHVNYRASTDLLNEVLSIL